MNFKQLVRVSKEYRQLGDNVQDQLDDILAGESLNDMNPNALKLIRAYVVLAEKYGVPDDYDIEGMIDDHLQEIGEE